MKILTLNTWQERGPWRLRWEIILKGIKEYQPDIIAFQEVFNYEWAQEIKDRAGYPFLVFHPEPSGLMLLSKKDVLHSACLTMKMQAPTETYRRYALFAEIRHRRGRVAVFNTHLSWQLNEGPIREAQAGELLDFIRLKAEAHDALAMGDFNAAPGTPEIRRMTEAGRFTDAFGQLYPGQAGLTWHNENPYARNASHALPDRRIDYIFVRPAKESVLGTLESVQILFKRPEGSGIWASDHYGLLAEFKDA